MDLSRLHERRIAIILYVNAECRVFKGPARYERGESDGSVLRIEPEGLGEEDGHPQFVIREDDWEGTVRPGTQYGCDFQIEVHADPK